MAASGLGTDLESTLAKRGAPTHRRAYSNFLATLNAPRLKLESAWKDVGIRMIISEHTTKIEECGIRITHGALPSKVFAFMQVQHSEHELDAIDE